MSARANPTIIGAFVLGAFILLVAGLLLWGGTGMFKPRYRVVMYFDAAVTGLQKGAPVILRGVRVGEVTDVHVRWGTWLATVYADLEPDVLKGVRPRDLDASLRQVIQERNLRAQLRMQSFVTGVLYVALDDFPGTPIVLRGLDKDVHELPTVPTDIEKWAAKVEKIADALATLPDELVRSMIAPSTRRHPSPRSRETLKASTGSQRWPRARPARRPSPRQSGTLRSPASSDAQAPQVGHGNACPGPGARAGPPSCRREDRRTDRTTPRVVEEVFGYRRHDI
jgi:paraquat-inducible protein B